MSTQKQMGNMIVYIDEKGQLYVEIDERIYHMEIGADVTEEVLPELPNLEVIEAFEPSEESSPGLEVIKTLSVPDLDAEDLQGLSEVFYKDPYNV